MEDSSAVMDSASAGHEALCTNKVGGPKLDIGPVGTGRLLAASVMYFSLARLDWPDGFHEPMETHDALLKAVITLLHELRDMPESLLVSFRA